ncbi:MAG: FAD-dependent oxidoreductase [Anaerolineales bacterium]|jgi:heterodisulfide reductase subunit A
MTEDRVFPGNPEPAAVLVVGGGIGGMRTALDLADSGLKVFLIEKTPCLGGRVAQLGYMFPQHDCILCRGTPDHGYGCTRPSISPAYIQHNRHPNIEFLTQTHLVGVQGQAGDFTVSLRMEPRYVLADRCINCGRCAAACPIELPDEYQQSLTKRRAAYKVSARAIPDAFVIDYGPYCEGCGKCVDVCPTDAIDLNQQPRLISANVGAIVLAIGFEAFNPSELGELGYGRFPNVLQAMEYERLASRSGPTEGMVVRPSDSRHPKSIAWLQCVGSRSKEIPFCSSICCMYATKEAILAKQRLGEDLDCTIFIMDERAFNKEHSKYFAAARERYGIEYINCRVSEIHEDPESHDLKLRYVDDSGRPVTDLFELVVLATGLQPPHTASHLAHMLEIELNEYGFCATDKFMPLQTSRPGVFVCGAFSSPKEIIETVIDASGAAAEVMRLLNERLNTHQVSKALPFLSRNNLPEEKDVSDEAPRIGFFGCSCGTTLSEVLDLSRLTRRIAEWEGVDYATVIPYACFDESIDRIQDAILSNDLNRVVVAACSNRTHDALFQRAIREVGLNPYLLELVNLREQCAHVHTINTSMANRKAEELIRLAVERVRVAEQVKKKKHRCRPTAMVLGGGVSGMTAALAIADSGYNVFLVERSEMLGGNLLNLHYVAEGYNPQRLLRDLVNRVRAHTRITTYTRTELVQHDGHVGFFRSMLQTELQDGNTREELIEYGVLIVATGGEESSGHPWQQHERVMTQRELEYKIIHAPEEIAQLKHVVMVQCMSSDGVAEYCSRVCCTNTMKNAIRLKLYNPNCQVTVLYKNIVTYGFRERFYTEARSRGVNFIRWTDSQPPQVVETDEGLKVLIRDPAVKRPVLLAADRVVLSMSISPSKGTRQLARLLRVPLSSEGFFDEAQLKLRPMDFMREGIFLAGMAHYPKFIEESISHALATAARALPLLSQESLHLGGVVAQVDPDKCVGCLTCTRVCPFEIPQVVHLEGRVGVGGLGGAAFIDDALCQGCGTCTGECPANAIQLIHYTDEQITLPAIEGLGQWRVGSTSEVMG